MEQSSAPKQDLCRPFTLNNHPTHPFLTKGHLRAAESHFRHPPGGKQQLWSWTGPSVAGSILGPDELLGPFWKSILITDSPSSIDAVGIQTDRVSLHLTQWKKIATIHSFIYLFSFNKHLLCLLLFKNALGPGMQFSEQNGQTHCPLGTYSLVSGSLCTLSD